MYDHMGRKTKTWEQLTYSSNLPTGNTLISQVDYNEIGQVLTKHLHSTDSTTFLQNIAYTYNERSWLLTSSAPLFAMQLYYNTGSRQAYNGNILYQYWGTPGSLTKSYSYVYDKLNRYLNNTTATGNYETGVTYDLNGNITALQRSGYANDNLTYTYMNSGQSNQIASIADVAGTNSGLTNGTTTFGNYDANGNLLSVSNAGNAAKNKTFTYNLLNLPQTVTTNTSATTTTTLTYTYDAAGNKLRRKSTGLSNTTDYIGGIQYDGATTPAFTFIQTEEGKAAYLPTTGGFDYYYYLGDNLGNTRVTFDTQTGAAAQTQKDDYYPFGLEINSSVTSPQNEYLYNKKELQEELGQYDYGARFYDPVIGRWNGIDELAEEFEHTSPYAYVLNNPINLADLDGRDTTKIIPLKEVFIQAVKPKPKPGPIKIEPLKEIKPVEPVGFPPPPVFTMPLLTFIFVLLPANLGDHTEADHLKAINARKYSKHGSYTIKFKNGKRYHGKGPYSRAIASAKYLADLHKTSFDYSDIDWTSAENEPQAFRDEAKRLEADGGKNNPNNYNQIDSPGSHKYKQDQ
jgi:RHS repeat-associated protein